MRQCPRAVRRNDSGFTLIELLVVVVLFGVLSGMVAVAVHGIKERARATACKTNQKSVEGAVEAYYAKHGSYPATLVILTAEQDNFMRATPTGVTLDPATGTVTASPAC